MWMISFFQISYLQQEQNPCGGTFLQNISQHPNLIFDQCRDPLGNIRSLVSEKMLEKLPAVCKFADNGCQVTPGCMNTMIIDGNHDDADMIRWYYVVFYLTLQWFEANADDCFHFRWKCSDRSLAITSKAVLSASSTVSILPANRGYPCQGARSSE